MALLRVPMTDSAHLFDDPEHFDDEMRIVLLGYADFRILLANGACTCAEQAVSGIVSARSATLERKGAFMKSLSTDLCTS